MNRMPISHLMSRKVLCVSQLAPLREAVELMHLEHCSSLVVVEAERPVGIITERDMVGILHEQLLGSIAPEKSVADYMASPAVCINQSATLYEALMINETRRIRHIPVVDDDQLLVGILTQSDITRAHFREIESQREDIEQQIKQRTQALEDANEELKALSLQDALMGIGNRRAMEVDVQFTHSNACRYHRPYCVALLDVDFFKSYNDLYGHQAGDDALKTIAVSAQASIRSSDRLYRYGGEELLLLLPESRIEDALTVVDRVLQDLHARAVEHAGSPLGYLSVSAGVSSFAPNENTEENGWQCLIAAADDLLYQAKESGRNRLCWQVKAPES